jgi:hypothetical protein
MIGLVDTEKGWVFATLTALAANTAEKINSPANNLLNIKNLLVR